MGQWPRYICCKSILLKYCDDTLQSPSLWSTHILEGKLKYWEQALILKKLHTFILNCVYLVTFIVILLSGNYHVLFEFHFLSVAYLIEGYTVKISFFQTTGNWNGFSLAVLQATYF